MASGKKRAGKKKNYYAAQSFKTESSKNRQMLKRKRSKDDWIKHGVKKNGEPVLTPAQKKLNKLNHIVPVSKPVVVKHQTKEERLIADLGKSPSKEAQLNPALRKAV